MTKLHWDTITGSKYQMALSQTLSRKVSMSLWLKEERKESSSSSEKQICLPPLPSCFFSERLFLLFSATAGFTSNPSWTGRLGGGKEAGQEGGEEGNNEAKGQPVFPFGDSSSWGKAAAPFTAGSPSQRALILRKKKSWRRKNMFYRSCSSPVQGFEGDCVEIATLTTRLWATPLFPYQRLDCTPKIGKYLV